MKKRLVSSLAMAGLLSLGLAGCTGFAPIATEIRYAPSDGITLDTADKSVELRNVLLIGEKDSKILNATFWVRANEPQKLVFSFVSKTGETVYATATASPEGVKYGAPWKGDQLMIVELPEQTMGSTVSLTVTTATGETISGDVPVLDGTLKEYQSYVLDKADVDAYKNGDKKLSKHKIVEHEPVAPQKPAEHKSGEHKPAEGNH